MTDDFADGFFIGMIVGMFLLIVMEAIAKWTGVL